MKTCNTCRTPNTDDTEYCSHCGASLNRDAAQPRTGGDGGVVGGIFTGFGIAAVYFVVETALASGTGAGYLLVGRICIGPILAIVWTLVVIATLVYAILNRTINKRLGDSYVAASAVTALALIAIPVALCTIIAFNEIPACQAPAV